MYRVSMWGVYGVCKCGFKGMPGVYKNERN